MSEDVGSDALLGLLLLGPGSNLAGSVLGMPEALRTLNAKMNPGKMYGYLDKFLEKHGSRIPEGATARRSPMNMGNHYNPVDRSIGLATPDETASLHELGHSQLHASPKTNPLSKFRYKMMEKFAADYQGGRKGRAIARAFAMSPVEKIALAPVDEAAAWMKAWKMADTPALRRTIVARGLPSYGSYLARGGIAALGAGMLGNAAFDFFADD